ncbi:hypothetical protein ACLB2K_019288 [Fragaria x ananassa]
MGPVSSGREVSNLEDDEKLDERAKRRLRRRLNAQVESLMLDDDYDKYLNKIHKYGWDWIEHSSGHDVNGDCEKEGNDTRVVEDSIDRNEHCGADDGDGGNSPLGDGNVNNRSVRDDDDDMDPQYKLFWDNLRENGNSYVLQIVQEDGRVKEIREIVENVEKAPEKRSSVKKRNVKFEAPEPVSDGIHVRSSKRHCLEVPNTPDIFGSSQLKEKTGTRRNSRMVIKQRNLDDCPQKKSSMLRKNVKETDTDNLSGRTNGGSNKKSGSKYLQLPEGGCNNEAESDSNLTDENYHEFLSCTKNDGKGLVFTSRIYGPLRYDEESSSDSDVVVLDRDPHEGYRTQITMDVDSRRSTESHSQFRQGIMQDLKRPYHLEEGIRKIISRDVQRSGKKMDAVTGDDRPRKLNLLRGFFYWLKNISQQGSFKPWNDKACLKVLPQKH